MGLLGISLIVASVVLFCLRPPAWLPVYLRSWRQLRLVPPPSDRPGQKLDSTGRDTRQKGVGSAQNGDARGQGTERSGHVSRRAAPLSPPRAIQQPEELNSSAEEEEEEQTTPIAAAMHDGSAVPSFSLSPSEPEIDIDGNQQSAQGPSLRAPTVIPSAAVQVAAAGTNGLMPPPPPPQPRRPSLNPSPAQPSPSPYSNQRSLPLPNRGPYTQAPSTSTLAPPPTHSSRPTPPRRPVTLTPGHSPLDWARLSSNPANNLSGLPPGTAYLRVAPSQLKAQNGRKGKNAWMVLGGRVYNVTPYLPFHPGGVGELMRGAGKDGTRLFGEVHPWVNYEGMLASCLVGVLVEEGEGWGQKAVESEMDKVD